MNKTIAAVLTGAGLGMALMYVFDPDRGRRRRALMRDKAVGLANDVSDAAGKTGRDLRNRATGLVHEAKNLIPDQLRSSESETSQAEQTRPI